MDALQSQLRKVQSACSSLKLAIAELEEEKERLSRHASEWERRASDLQKERDRAADRALEAESRGVAANEVSG